MDRNPKMNYCIRLTIHISGAEILYQIKTLLHSALWPLTNAIVNGCHVPVEKSYTMYRWCKVVFKGKE